MEKNENKKLYLSDTDKKLGGVIGGIAERFGLDSTMLRLLAIFVTLVTGFVPGILTYLFALIIVPPKPGSASSAVPPKSAMAEKQKADAAEQQKTDASEDRIAVKKDE
jgi:phage shock protein C